MSSGANQLPCDLDLSSAGAVVLLILGYGENADRMRWSLISHAWQVTLRESPDLFRDLHLDSTAHTAANQLVKLSGSRLVRLERKFVTDEFLSMCADAAPCLRELLLAPSPDLTSLPTVWNLETLDVRGSLSVLPAIPAVCTSLRHLKLGWWKEQDPDGRQMDLSDWVPQWVRSRKEGQLSRLPDLVGSIALQATHLRVLHIHGHVHPGNFAGLANLAEIEAIHLPYAVYGINASVMSRLSAIPSLKALNIRACNVDVPDVRNLEFLNVSCTRMTPASLARLGPRCPGLRVLDLCYAPLLDRSVLPDLAEHRHPLEMIGLGGFDLDDDDMELIVRTWTGLRNLGIGSAKATARGLRRLCSLPKLTRLCAHKLEQLQESVVWELLQQVQQIDVSDSDWASEPSPELLAAIEARPYDYDYY